MDTNYGKTIIVPSMNGKTYWEYNGNSILQDGAPKIDKLLYKVVEFYGLW